MRKTLFVTLGLIAGGFIQCGKPQAKSSPATNSESEAWQAFPASIVEASQNEADLTKVNLKLSYASGWNIKAVRLNPESNCKLTSFPPTCDTTLEVQGTFNGQEVGVMNSFTVDLPKPQFEAYKLKIQAGHEEATLVNIDFRLTKGIVFEIERLPKLLNCENETQSSGKEFYSFLIDVKKIQDEPSSLVGGNIKLSRLFPDSDQPGSMKREEKSLEVVWFDADSKTIFFKPAGFLTLNSDKNEYIYSTELNGNLVDKRLSNCLVPEPGVVITN